MVQAGKCCGFNFRGHYSFKLFIAGQHNLHFKWRPTCVFACILSNFYIAHKVIIRVRYFE
jgi:hypothetical protein